MAIRTGFKAGQVENLIRNLNKQVTKMEDRSLQSLISAAALIRRSADSQSPKIPVDLGNLRKSWFTVTSNQKVIAGKSPNFTGKQTAKLSASHAAAIRHNMGVLKRTKGPAVRFGFSAFYSTIVHEMQGVTWSRKGSGPKYLEASLKRNKDEIMKIIQKGVKIPK